jgi:Icc-related predicted phosphoesterase
VSRVLFCTDIHGNNRSYASLFDKAVAHAVHAVVFGGDITVLPPRNDPQAVTLQRDWITHYLAPAFRSFRREHPEIALYTMLGNDDWTWNLDLFDLLERDGVCGLLHMKAQPFLDGLSIAGYSCVPMTPFFMKDLDRLDSRDWEPKTHPRRCCTSKNGQVTETPYKEIRERPTIEEELAALGTMSDPRRTLYVVHTPPSDTLLDVIHNGEHIGSPALRRFLEQHEPLLALHGHVHESPEMTGAMHDTVGHTFCVNPGDSLHELQAVLFELADPAGTLRRV